MRVNEELYKLASLVYRLAKRLDPVDEGLKEYKEEEVDNEFEGDTNEEKYHKLIHETTELVTNAGIPAEIASLFVNANIPDIKDPNALSIGTIIYDCLKLLPSHILVWFVGMCQTRKLKFQFQGAFSWLENLITGREDVLTIYLIYRLSKLVDLSQFSAVGLKVIFDNIKTMQAKSGVLLVSKQMVNIMRLYPQDRATFDMIREMESPISVVNKMFHCKLTKKEVNEYLEKAKPGETPFEWFVNEYYGNENAVDEMTEEVLRWLVNKNTLKSMHKSRFQDHGAGIIKETGQTYKYYDLVHLLAAPDIESPKDSVEKVFERLLLRLKEEREENVFKTLEGYEQPFVIDEITFTPLIYQDMLDNEGMKMDHCVEEYGKRCELGNSFIFHLKSKDAESTLELSKTGKVVQLLGPNNDEEGLDEHRDAANKLSKEIYSKTNQYYDNLINILVNIDWSPLNLKKLDLSADNLREYLEKNYNKEGIENSEQMIEAIPDLILQDLQDIDVARNFTSINVLMRATKENYLAIIDNDGFSAINDYILFSLNKLKKLKVNKSIDKSIDRLDKILRRLDIVPYTISLTNFTMSQHGQFLQNVMFDLNNLEKINDIITILGAAHEEYKIAASKMQ